MIKQKKFLTDLYNNIDTIHSNIESDTTINDLLNSGFQRLKERDRKTVTKVLLSHTVSFTGYTEVEVVDILAKLHMTILKNVSTTESDLYDLLYNVDLLNAIQYLKNEIEA